MKIHRNATYIQVDNNYKIYSLGYYFNQNQFKLQILFYCHKNIPLKLKEYKYFSKMSGKLRFQPIDKLYELI